MTGIIVVFGAITIAAWVTYHMGFATGFEAGKQDALDQIAMRHERLKRFNSGYEN